MGKGGSQHCLVRGGFPQIANTHKSFAVYAEAMQVKEYIDIAAIDQPYKTGKHSVLHGLSG